MVSAIKCPTCRVEIAWEGNPHRPFCSERCRLIDLGAWVEGKYRIAGEKPDDQREESDDGEEEEPR